MELLGSGIDRNDPATWRNAQWPQTTHGLFQNQGVGLWPGVCATRVATAPLFCELFDHRPVISSFDGVSFCRPDSQNRAYAAELRNQKNLGEETMLSSWCHTDQGKLYPDCARHFQAAVALTELGTPETRTQLVVPKGDQTVQEFRDAFLARFPHVPVPKGTFDPEEHEWHKHSQAERKWLIEHGNVITPTLKPGEMLLWDSGMPHASVPGPQIDPATPRNVRISVFVSMLPIELVDADDLALRQDMLEKGYTSGHRVTTTGKRGYRACKFAETGRTYGKEIPKFTPNVVTGFKQAFEAGDKESLAYKMAVLCGGYGYTPVAQSPYAAGPKKKAAGKKRARDAAEL